MAEYKQELLKYALSRLEDWGFYDADPDEPIEQFHHEKKPDLSKSNRIMLTHEIEVFDGSICFYIQNSCLILESTVRKVELTTKKQTARAIIEILQEIMTEY